MISWSHRRAVVWFLDQLTSMPTCVWINSIVDNKFNVTYPRSFVTLHTFPCALQFVPYTVNPPKIVHIISSSRASQEVQLCFFYVYLALTPLANSFSLEVKAFVHYFNKAAPLCFPGHISALKDVYPQRFPLFGLVFLCPWSFLASVCRAAHMSPCFHLHTSGDVLMLACIYF